MCFRGTIEGRQRQVNGSKNLFFLLNYVQVCATMSSAPPHETNKDAMEGKARRSLLQY